MIFVTGISGQNDYLTIAYLAGTQPAG